MLELADVSYVVDEGEIPTTLIHEVAARFPEGHFCAILGPSGCGKSTLLKLIAGLLPPTRGSVHWQGRDLAVDEDLAPQEVGYVPQFSIAYELLSARESITDALRLRVGGQNALARKKRADLLLEETGLTQIADRLVKHLSGGQRRRLSLALELASQPSLLLCDEVTSGLDPKAEDEIVKLMRKLSREGRRIVLSVTHSLRHAHLYDSVLILHEGHVIFHGSPEFLPHYFTLDALEGLFPKLATRKAEEWHRSWRKHRGAYYAVHADAYQTVSRAEDEAPSSVTYEQLARIEAKAASKKGKGETAKLSATPPATVPPGRAVQCMVIFRRRWKLLFRDRGQCLLQIAMLFGFPCLVLVFGWGGLPEIRNLTPNATTNLLQEAMESARFLADASRTGSLVSGMVMFQVILLTLMGSNNGAREVAGERLIFEKEKFAGVSTGAWVMAKALFLAIIVLVQSSWMAAFISIMCRFPGDLLSQIGLLTLVNGAVTSLCLAISSRAKTPEQASLLSVYLVGFQLPLSGAVLALPHWLEGVIRPLISAYWGWAGYLKTFTQTRHYDAVLLINHTELLALPLCYWVLGCHLLLGLFLAWTGCRKGRWE